jgi:hypothetical protein
MPVSPRSPSLLAVGAVMLLETLIAGRIAVANGFVGSLPPQTLDELQASWLVSGSAVSIPLPPLLALAAFVALAQLRWQWARVTAGVGSVLLACLFVFATFGEETFLSPVSALEFGLQVVILAMALALAAAGVRTALGRPFIGTADRVHPPFVATDPLP